MEKEKCAVCGKDYNPFDPLAWPPVCRKICWLKWVYLTDHKGQSCWVPGCLEVYCGTRTDGYCYKCEVFKIEEEIRKRGLNKETLIGNY